MLDIFFFDAIFYFFKSDISLLIWLEGNLKHCHRNRRENSKFFWKLFCVKFKIGGKFNSKCYSKLAGKFNSKCYSNWLWNSNQSVALNCIHWFNISPHTSTMSQIPCWSVSPVPPVLGDEPLLLTRDKARVNVFPNLISSNDGQNYWSQVSFNR